MKKFFAIFIMLIGFAFNINADDYVRISNIAYPDSKTVRVTVSYTNKAQAELKDGSNLYFKVTPNTGKKGILEGAKYGSIQVGMSNAKTIDFTCDDNEAKSCKAYDFNVETTDMEKKEKK